MKLDQLYRFIQTHRLAVLSSISTRGDPQSALVGIAVSPQLRIVFDTLKSTRKYTNLKADPRISFVIGWEDETTLQYEGIAVEPEGSLLQEAKDTYFLTWPGGIERQRWPGITWFLVMPTWLRYSNFNSGHIEEMTFVVGGDSSLSALDS